MQVFFYRLDFIEKFGTGIMRINEEYTDSIVKPGYEISDNYIRIILPVIDVEGNNLSEDESVVLEIFRDEIEISRAELDEKTKFNKTKSLRILNSLIDKNIVKKEGSGPGVTYRLK
ncbi:MAG TPA: hypothetical protein DC024_11250 [Clostridiales bacterium]|nr:hypothetical protein [Clostridiales bacterium]HCS10266.1 hypothetical protein [Clostridiales bacterium]